MGACGLANCGELIAGTTPQYGSPGAVTGTIDAKISEIINSMNIFLILDSLPKGQRSDDHAGGCRQESCKLRRNGALPLRSKKL